MTADDITKAINNVFATPEDLQATLATLNLQSQVKQIDIQIDALQQKRTEVLAPIENERIDLTNKRADLIASLQK